MIVFFPPSFLSLQYGRVDALNNKIAGHKGPVLDIKWNPFNDNEIASSSDDGTVSLILSCSLTPKRIVKWGQGKRVQAPVFTRLDGYEQPVMSANDSPIHSFTKKKTQNVF